MRRIPKLVESDVQRTARILARKFDVTIKFRGNMCEVDPENRVIYLPSLPEEIDEEFSMALRGFMDHEVAHMEYTDREEQIAWLKEKLNDRRAPAMFLRTIWNSVEDAWVEREFGKRYPGSKLNFRRSHDYCVRKKIDVYSEVRSGGEDVPESNQVVEGIYRRALGEELPEYMSDGAAEFVEKLQPTIDKVDDVYSTGEAAEVADELWEGIKEILEERQKEEEQEEQEQEEQEEQEKQEEHGEKEEDQEEKEEGEDEDGEQQAQGDGQSQQGGDGSPDNQDGEEGSDQGGDQDQPGGDQESSDQDSGSQDQDDQPEEGGDQSEEDEQDQDGQPSDPGQEGQPDQGQEGQGEKGPLSGQKMDIMVPGAGGGAQQEIEELKAKLGAEEVGSEDGITILRVDADAEMPDGESMEEMLGKMGIMPLDMLQGAVEEAIEDLAASSQYRSWSTEDDTVERPPERPDRQAHQKFQEGLKYVGGVRSRLLKYLLGRDRTYFLRGRTRGELDSRALHRVISNGSNRVFRKRKKVEGDKSACTLLLDTSGSMNGQKLKLVGQLSMVFGEALNRLSFPTEVIGFTSRGYGGANMTYEEEEEANRANFARTFPLNYSVFQQFGEPWRSAARRLASLRATGGTPVGEALLFAGRRIAQRPEARKLIFCLTDGQPTVGCRGLTPTEHASQCVEQLEQSGIETIGIGIQTDSVVDIFPRSACIGRLDDLLQRFMLELTRALTGREIGA